MQTDPTAASPPSREHGILNVFSCGSLVQSNSANGIAISSDGDRESSDTPQALVWIVNEEARPRRVRLVEAVASTDFRPGELTLVIEDVSEDRPVLVYEGELGGLPSAGIELGSFEAAEERAYRFRLHLDRAVRTAAAGGTAGGGYEWEPA